MRIAMSIGFAALLAGCAGAASRPQSEGAQGSWQGFLLRDGVRQSMSVELADRGSEWDGRFFAGKSSGRLQSVRVEGNNVHFEAPGEGVFDGAVAEGAMAGSVSGPADGSFSFTRSDPDWNPYPSGP